MNSSSSVLDEVTGLVCKGWLCVGSVHCLFNCAAVKATFDFIRVAAEIWLLNWLGVSNRGSSTPKGRIFEIKFSWASSYSGTSNEKKSSGHITTVRFLPASSVCAPFSGPTLLWRQNGPDLSSLFVFSACSKMCANESEKIRLSLRKKWQSEKNVSCVWH